MCTCWDIHSHAKSQSSGGFTHILFSDKENIPPNRVLQKSIMECVLFPGSKPQTPHLEVESLINEEFCIYEVGSLPIVYAGTAIPLEVQVLPTPLSPSPLSRCRRFIHVKQMARLISQSLYLHSVSFSDVENVHVPTNLSLMAKEVASIQ